MKEITAEQYRQLSALGESPSQEDLIRVLYGKPKGKMTLKEVGEIDFAQFRMPEATVLPDLVLHEGVLYGKQDLSNMTFGLYIDLVEQAKDIQSNLILLMTMLWRPITKISYWNRAKAYLASKMLTSKSKWARLRGLRLLAGVKYEIKDYDVMDCFGREDLFKTLPGTLAAYTTTFFLTTSQVLVVDSLRSLRANLEQQKTALQESLRKISQDGDGSPTSGSLQEKEQSK